MSDFIPGVTSIPASNAVIGIEERIAMVEAVGRGWLTAGPENRKFEQALSDFTGIKHVRTCNSGSSANLLAVATMVEAGYWKAGDEIITAACAFPTTVNPLLLYGLVPVFVDVDIGTYNMIPEAVEDAIGPKTKGIMAAHTLGNPFDAHINWLAERHNFGLVHDCCDALGSTYETWHGAIKTNTHVGKHAHLATCSFFPAHHITTGEGGAVFSNDAGLISIAESIRDWGRDCWCEPGKENTCGKRFEQQFGELPYGYDHKYTYSRLGYNLKLTEISAACGLAQTARLQSFIDSRRKNWGFISNRLVGLEDKIILPKATAGSNPSWFGFPITIKKEGERTALQEYLDQNKIGSRLLFSGNITKQPYMKGRNYRISGSLENSDKIMKDTLWIGVWPGLTEEMLSFVCDKIKAFFQ